MSYKYGFDNVGDIVVTDGDVFVGFPYSLKKAALIELEIKETLSERIPWTEDMIEFLGIDKITEWHTLDEFNRLSNLKGFKKYLHWGK